MKKDLAGTCILFLILMSCISRSEIGRENERCFEDGSCLDGLICNSDFVCVKSIEIQDTGMTDIALKDVSLDAESGECTNDLECPLNLPICDIKNKKCVQCLIADDCMINSKCDNNECKCNDGFANCNDLWSDGCEAQIGTVDWCGKDCNNYVNCSNTVKNVESVICNSTKFECEYSSCIYPFEDKDGNKMNGCELLDYFPRKYKHGNIIIKEGFDSEYLFIMESVDRSYYGEMDNRGNIKYSKTILQKNFHFSDIERVDSDSFFVAGYNKDDKVLLMKDYKNNPNNINRSFYEFNCIKCETLNFVRVVDSFYITVREGEKLVMSVGSSLKLNASHRVELDTGTFNVGTSSKYNGRFVIAGHVSDSNKNIKGVFILSPSTDLTSIINKFVFSFDNPDILQLKDLLITPDNMAYIAGYYKKNTKQGVFVIKFDFKNPVDIKWSKLLTEMNVEYGNIKLLSIKDNIYMFIDDVFSSSSIAFSFNSDMEISAEVLGAHNKFNNIKVANVMYEDPIFILSGKSPDYGFAMAINENLSVFYDCPSIQTNSLEMMIEDINITFDNQNFSFSMDSSQVISNEVNYDFIEMTQSDIQADAVCNK